MSHVKITTNFPMHFTVKLSEHNFYHHKRSCKHENMLKKVLTILFGNLVS